MLPVLQNTEHPGGSHLAGDLERPRQDQRDWQPLQHPECVSGLEEETAETAAQWQRSASNVSLTVAPPTKLTYEQITMTVDKDPVSKGSFLKFYYHLLTHLMFQNWGMNFSKIVCSEMSVCLLSSVVVHEGFCWLTWWIHVTNLNLMEIFGPHENRNHVDSYWSDWILHGKNHWNTPANREHS